MNISSIRACSLIQPWLSGSKAASSLVSAIPTIERGAEKPFTAKSLSFNPLGVQFKIGAAILKREIGVAILEKDLIDRGEIFFPNVLGSMTRLTQLAVSEDKAEVIDALFSNRDIQPTDDPHFLEDLAVHLLHEGYDESSI